MWTMVLIARMVLALHIAWLRFIEAIQLYYLRARK